MFGWLQHTIQIIVNVFLVTNQGFENLLILINFFSAHASLYTSNVLIGLLYLFAKGDSGAMFGLALVYWFLFTPASYMCWFRPVYKAFRDDSSMYFMVFFFTFFFQFLLTIIYTLGIGGMGSR